MPAVPRQRTAEAHLDIGMLVAAPSPGSVVARARALVRDALRERGIPVAEVEDAELAVAELAVNAERHGRPPYEVRIFEVAAVPVWCEVVDADPGLGRIPAMLDREAALTAADLFAESGRGLLLVRALSGGYCRAYRTATFTTDAPAKTVAFALPTSSGTRLTYPPLFHLARHQARLLP
ncbi:ATP-binding protein [Sphaerisporangium rubeum]|uniref:Anti-sigma regulatory factor (Ser/Thr protein kinase) n=1 Tax=Sphaerisporangium rubeum TaxID=321317 RepID=A0A7X0M6F3_9ACTN|nr:anti-sigma regulatory factor (Ser/Thr protein kinase) [Sphaerisporangium rubeum]